MVFNIQVHTFKTIDPFLTKCLILKPLITPENKRVFYVFKGCKIGTLAKNELI